VHAGKGRERGRAALFGGIDNGRDLEARRLTKAREMRLRGDFPEADDRAAMLPQR